MPLNRAVPTVYADVIETLIGAGANPSMPVVDRKKPFDRLNEGLRDIDAYRQIKQGT